MSSMAVGYALGLSDGESKLLYAQREAELAQAAAQEEHEQEIEEWRQALAQRDANIAHLRALLAEYHQGIVQRDGLLSQQEAEIKALHYKLSCRSGDAKFLRRMLLERALKIDQLGKALDRARGVGPRQMVAPQDLKRSR
jgi:hypothetical protein